MTDAHPPAETVPTPPTTPVSMPPTRPTRFHWSLAIVFGIVCGLALIAYASFTKRDEVKAESSAEQKQPLGMNDLGKTEPIAIRRVPNQDKKDAPEEKKKIPAPELDGGIAWLNTGGPVSIKKDLKGKVVLLDFWTLCCINCIHIMPDLAKLEKKYANELVVIGVHSPKFENEKVTASIRKAILRYQIEHPVVNDANHIIWDRYEVDAWPTLVLIDPEGNLVGYTSGEGNYELLDVVIGKIVDEHKKKKTLNEKPIRFDLAKYRESGDTPLFFPGKVVADAKGKRLFIADSTHHRIVVTDLDGHKIAVIGTGVPGKADGAFDVAEFCDPQGMAIRGDTVYVADRKNHLIREIDLKAKTVTTLAGNGSQDHDIDSRRMLGRVQAKEIGLNSPWDVLLDGEDLYIAMAGHHQIWLLNLKDKTIGPFAGSGRETLTDGLLRSAAFAQPSGLTTDGKHLFVADSETSSLRQLPLTPDAEARVTTLVGRALFAFGDRDGLGQDGGELSTTEARMQHALGVAYHDGKVFVADTYNSKIKEYDLRTRKLKTLVNGHPFGFFGPATFSEPGGISYANGKLYVADTNAHRIRVIDLATKAVSTLQLTGVAPPPTPKLTKMDPKKEK